IEPYPTPNLLDQDLIPILEAISFTDKIIFGRTNYNKEVSSFTNHKKFYNQKVADVIEFCKASDIQYHIKDGTLTSSYSLDKQ
ncbi:MAG: radical SAM protein, partial [Limnochordia bacterium]